MTVIEFAEHRKDEEEKEYRLGADNASDRRYWAAYLDGARAQWKEDEKRCADCQDKAGKMNKGPIVVFSVRLWVEREFIKWCEENNVAKVGNALVVFMLNHDWINRDKLVKDYMNRDKEDA